MRACFVWRSQAKGLDIVQRSILGPMLPEAMVCYLENYEAERFSEIFLGEFDTPEAIWSSEMRLNASFSSLDFLFCGSLYISVYLFMLHMCSVILAFVLKCFMKRKLILFLY